MNKTKNTILIILSIILGGVIVMASIKRSLANAAEAGISETQYWKYHGLETQSGLLYGGIGGLVVLAWAWYLTRAVRPQPKPIVEKKRHPLFEENDGTHDDDETAELDHRK